MDYINSVRHVADSSSQDEFFGKVIGDVKKAMPLIEKSPKAKDKKYNKLLKEIVQNYGVMLALDYSHKR